MFLVWQTVLKNKTFFFLFLQDWVVGKYGRVLPVVTVRSKDKRKVSFIAACIVRGQDTYLHIL